MMNFLTERAFASRTLDGFLSNLAQTARGRKQLISGAIDAGTVIVALWLAYSFRAGAPFSDLASTWHVFALLAPATVLTFAALGIYRWVVRSSSPHLFVQLAKASALSTVLLVLIITVFPPFNYHPRSLFPMYALLVLLGSSTTRLAWQARFGIGRLGTPVAVYGAGQRGRRTVGLLGSSEEYRTVALIDDDPDKAGQMVGGLKVLDGSDPQLHDTLRRLDVQQIAVAYDPLRALGSFDATLARFDRLGYRTRMVPGVAEMLDGARDEPIRDVSIADILGRQEVVPDPDLIGRRVTGRCVLVTGGAGSIGSELARQILKLSPERLVIMDSCESALYEITEELRAKLREAGEPNGRFVPLLGSVRDRDTLSAIMSEHRIQTIFHAAAYKHVPIVEAQPCEGIETNLFGTRRLLEVAIEAGVDDLVLVSTDKAVRPTNAMGATKRAAELLLQGMARRDHGTRLSMVRFGNVLGSSGSVVPKFKRQILEGGPVTVTDPEVTRYFMTIPEAAQLVLQAGALARGGEVFVLDMGEPVRIVDLARTMVRLFGKSLQEETGDPADIRIVFEGLRPGEKPYEELFLDGRDRPTGVAKISCASEAWLPWEELGAHLDSLREAMDQRDVPRQRAELLALAGAGRIDGAARALSRARTRTPVAVATGLPERRSANDRRGAGSRVARGVA